MPELLFLLTSFYVAFWQHTYSPWAPPCRCTSVSHSPLAGKVPPPKPFDNVAAASLQTFLLAEASIFLHLCHSLIIGEEEEAIHQKNSRVRKMFVRNSGAGNGCANFMGTWKNALFLQEKPMSIKFLLLGGGYMGGVFWVFGGGGGVPNLIYGREDFSEYVSLQIALKGTTKVSAPCEKGSALL